MMLVMGPWTHGGNNRSTAGDIEFGEAAAIEDFARDFHLRWFDARLKGQGTFAPFADERTEGESAGPVTLFVMGGGRRPPGRKRPSVPRRRVADGPPPGLSTGPG